MTRRASSRLLERLTRQQDESSAGSIQSAVNQGDALIRGRLDDVFRRGESVFALGAKLSTPNNPELTIEVGLRDG